MMYKEVVNVYKDDSYYIEGIIGCDLDLIGVGTRVNKLRIESNIAIPPHNIDSFINELHQLFKKYTK